MTTAATEQLYSELAAHAGLVRRVGLREAIGVLEPRLRDRASVGDAVHELHGLTEQHRRHYTNGAELNFADFLETEIGDVAYQLDTQLA